jgi:hypothetical protein
MSKFPEVVSSSAVIVSRRFPVPRQFHPTAQYYLVETFEQWQSVADAGLDPIITHLRFSTDPRSDLAARLGRMIMPWRWRRTILNAGIVEVRYTRGAPVSPIVGAMLAGVRLVRCRVGRMRD